MSLSSSSDDLTQLRHRIDAIDEELVILLAQRTRIVDQIVETKKMLNVPARIPARIDEIMQRLARLATQHHTNQEMLCVFMRTMIEWFIAHEEQVLGTKEG